MGHNSNNAINWEAWLKDWLYWQTVTCPMDSRRVGGLIGVSHNTVCRVNSAESYPSAEFFIAACLYMGKSAMDYANKPVNQPLQLGLPFNG